MFYGNNCKKSLALICSLIIASACTTSDETDAEQRELDRAEEQMTKASTRNNIQTPFPEDSSAIKIKKLTLSYQLPDEPDLFSCKESLKETSQAIKTLQDFTQQTEKMLFIVDREPALFHWCFFSSIVDLDHQLEYNDLGNTYDNIEFAYNERLKSLWVLSVALDIVNKTDDYYDILRNIYVRQSEYYFNRVLESYADPLYMDQKYKLKKQRAAAEYKSGIKRSRIIEDSDIEYDAQ